MRLIPIHILIKKYNSDGGGSISIFDKIYRESTLTFYNIGGHYYGRKFGGFKIDKGKYSIFVESLNENGQLNSITTKFAIRVD